MEANERRRHRAEEREAVRRHRELQKYQKEQAKQSEYARAANEVKEFEIYLELLVSLHKERGEVWQWERIAASHPPTAPSFVARHEPVAAGALSSYEPGFIERLFGGAKRRTAALEVALVEAQNADRAEFAQASEVHRAAQALWEYRRHLAARVLNRETAMFKEALAHAEAFDELNALHTDVAVTEADPDAVVLTCRTAESSPVPTEELKLSAGGKVSTKAMPGGRFWALHQDYVCSSALRAASETLAVLPVARVIVNVGSVQTNTSTGHPEFATILALHCSKRTLLGLNLTQVDASDAMKNFPHRMKFKKSSGFELVEPMTLQENWVTT